MTSCEIPANEKLVKEVKDILAKQGLTAGGVLKVLKKSASRQI